MPKANEVKNVKKTAEADVKKVTEVKTAPVKAEVKTEEKKATAVKATDTKTAEVKAPEKAAETKTPAVKKTTATKAAAKKETTKKAAAKTTASRKKVAESVCIQYGGREIELSEIVEKAKAAYTGDAKNMKEIKVYVKPEENMAYFVVNGDETGSVGL